MAGPTQDDLQAQAEIMEQMKAALQSISAEFDKMGAAAKNATDAMKDGMKDGQKSMSDVTREQQSNKTSTDDMTESMKKFFIIEWTVI